MEMNTAQKASQIAAKQMFTDQKFWDEVEETQETIENARVKPSSNQPSLSGIRVTYRY